jgi:large subunit ribosomal protein L28
VAEGIPAWRTRGEGFDHAYLLPLCSLIAMAKVCHSCGKGPSFGNSRSHSMVATKRRFDPNLQKVRALVAGAPRRVYVCTRCLKAGKVTKAV